MLASRLFRVLLLTYPPALRREHGVEMTLVFAERWRDRPALRDRVRLLGDLVIDFLTSWPQAWRASIFPTREPAPRRGGGPGHVAGDIRGALRLFTRTPLFAAGAVVTLALGIGAATAVFSLADATLLRPLPIPAPERVVQMGFSWSYPDFRDLVAQQNAFSSLAAWTGIKVGIEHGGATSRMEGAGVSGRYFALAGQQPVAGRLLTENDDRPGAPAVAVLSERVWRELFAADPGLVGASVSMNRRPVTVVGIAPARFRGLSLGASPDVFVPIVDLPAISTGFLARPNLLENRSIVWLQVAGRLQDGGTIELAQAQTSAIYRRLHPPKASAEPEDRSGGQDDQTQLAPLLAHALGLKTAGDLRQLVFVLLGATTLTLLLSCATVANLMLVRAERRRRELAMRAALGASRWRLGQLLLIESLAIGLAGGAGGVMVARGTLALLQAFTLPGRISIADLGLALDSRLLVSAVGLGLLTALLFGLAPIWQTTRLKLSNTLRDGGRGSSRQPLRSALVTVQVALCVLLLGGGLAFGRALRFALGTNLGFDTSHAAIITADPLLARYTRAQSADLQRQVRDALVGQPWVSAVAWAAMRPLEGSMMWQVNVPGQTTVSDADKSIETNVVSTGFFAAMAIPVLAGRPIDDTDTATSPTVAVISQAAARRFWPADDALGSRFSLDADAKDPNAWATVVGITADIRRGINGSTPPMLYLASTQHLDMLDFGGQNLVVRSTSMSPADALREAQAVMRRVAPVVPIIKAETLAQELDGVLMTQRMGLTLFLLFAGLAVVLTVFGVYAIVAYAVATRTREIGIRVALGAARAAVLRVVVAQGLAPVGLGLAAGLASFVGASAALSRFMFALPIGTPLSMAALAAGVLIVAAVALVVPSRRALRVDPSVALRGE